MRLPQHIGKYPVGFAAFTLPVTNERTTGRAQLADGTPALKLQETAFNIFYPAEATEKKSGVKWMPRPVGAFLRGYAAFMGISQWLVITVAYFWASLIRMPVHDNAKLAVPEKSVTVNSDADESPKWPVVIFSHGLGGTRTAYSQFCGNLASEGYIVIALEHHDYSGPMFISTSASQEQPYIKSPPRWEGGEKPSDPFAWRVEQLAFRRMEIYETFHAFAQAVDTGKPGAIQNAGFDWTEWRDRVECGQNVILAGHSFGSATTMSILSHPPADGFAPFPVTQVVLLDPWVEPFGPSGPLALPDLPPALCVIASEGFTIWDSHFERLKEIVKGWKMDGATAHLTTILRSGHQDFSDFGVIVPGPVGKRSREVIHGTHETVMKFIRGSLDDELKGKGAVMEIERIKRNKRQIKGEPGELFVHE